MKPPAVSAAALRELRVYALHTIPLLLYALVRSSL